MARKAGSAEFQSYLDSFDRRAEGAGSSKDTDRFSGLDIRTAFDNRGDLSKAEGAQMVLDYADTARDAGSKMGGAADDALDKLRGYVKAGEAKPEPEAPTKSKDAPTTVPASKAGKAAAGDNSIASPISQANPINIDGNRNRVNQDNSISQSQNFDYSIDNSKVLNDNSYRSYGADGGGGKYGGADDSPAAAARFMDMYIDSNRLNQRSMRNEFDFFDNKNYGANDPFGAQNRERGLDKSIAESRGRSDQMKKSLYGGVNPFGADFKLPEAPDPVKSNAEEIYEKALKKIK
tara:strand:+ start:19 stop:891 length:873 start_codon:yes stop_codon:yes gene_type:complete